jgi:hypothetical protein
LKTKIGKRGELFMNGKSLQNNHENVSIHEAERRGLRINLLLKFIRESEIE